MRVTVDEFLTRVAAFYDTPQAPNRKGTVAISCKSVPTARVFPKDAKAAAAIDANVLLFRAAKYGNNHHKTKYSVVVSSSAQAAFHSQLSHIVKTKAERKGLPVKGAGAGGTTKRSGKKTTE